MTDDLLCPRHGGSFNCSLFSIRLINSHRTHQVKSWCFLQSDCLLVNSTLDDEDVKLWIWRVLFDGVLLNYCNRKPALYSLLSGFFLIQRLAAIWTKSKQRWWSHREKQACHPFGFSRENNIDILHFIMCARWIFWNVTQLPSSPWRINWCWLNPHLLTESKQNLHPRSGTKNVIKRISEGDLMLNQSNESMRSFPGVAVHVMACNIGNGQQQIKATAHQTSGQLNPLSYQLDCTINPKHLFDQKFQNMFDWWGRSLICTFMWDI